MKLMLGEEICPDCKGSGNNSKAEENCSLDFICFRCRGTGKIDWVQKAMGPQPINPYDSVTIPLVRHKYPKLIAEKIAGVQPMPERGMKDAKRREH